MTWQCWLGLLVVWLALSVPVIAALVLSSRISKVEEECD